MSRDWMADLQALRDEVTPRLPLVDELEPDEMPKGRELAVGLVAWAIVIAIVVVMLAIGAAR